MDAGVNVYQYNGKELNTDFDVNWLDYGARWYDPAIGRFGSIDRFAEKYASMTPYQYGANDPIKNIDVNGDYIVTYFYDKDGKELDYVPEIIKKMFQSEYGIDVGYDSKNHQLYMVGTVKTDNKIGEKGLELVINALDKDKKTDTELYFGYNLGYTRVSNNEYGIGHAEHIGKEGHPGAVLIDLADFKEDGALKSISVTNLDPRALNMARAFEHEFFGHGVKGFGGTLADENADNVPFINEYFRSDYIPNRDGYTKKRVDKFDGGGTLRWLSGRDKKIKKVITGKKYYSKWPR